MLERAGVQIRGLFACHRCDNPSCVNPDHLYAGTHQDNMDDKGRRGRYPNNAGEANPFHKLTDADVAQVRTMYATGAFTQRELARHFRISQSHVGRIVRGESWEHIYSLST